MQSQRTNRMALMLSDDEVAKVQDFRFAHRIGSQSGAIRRLIERGLQSTKENGPVEGATSPSLNTTNPR